LRIASAPRIRVFWKKGKVHRARSQGRVNVEKSPHKGGDKTL